MNHASFWIMTTVLTITDLLVLAQSPHPTEVVSVGVVIDGMHVAWGLCPGDAAHALENIVRPALLDQPAGSFRDLCARIDALTEETQRPAPVPEPDTETPKNISRRAFLTGRLLPGAEPAPLVTLEQPLRPVIRFGVSQALLGALALAADKTPADILAHEYGLPRATAPIPLQLALPSTFDPATLPRSTGIAAAVATYGYRVPDGDPETVLGKDATVLQRFVRTMKQHFTANGDNNLPALHLDLRGKLGKLMGEDAGKMLGALYGLERAALPLSLRVENPGDNKIESLHDLARYVRMRNMRLQLAAEADTPAGARALAESETVGWVRIDPAKLGTLAQTVEAVQVCREMGGRALLGGGSGTAFEGAPMAAQLAVAVRPTVLEASSMTQLRLISIEMARVLACTT